MSEQREYGKRGLSPDAQVTNSKSQKTSTPEKAGEGSRRKLENLFTETPTMDTNKDKPEDFMSADDHSENDDGNITDSTVKERRKLKRKTQSEAVRDLKSALKDLIKNIAIEKNARGPGRMPGRRKNCEQIKNIVKINKILKSDGGKKIRIITKDTERQILNILLKTGWLRPNETEKNALYQITHHE